MNWCVFFYDRCQFLIGLRNTSCMLIWNSWNIIYFLHIDILYYCCTITLNWGSNTTKSRQHNYKWNQFFRALFGGDDPDCSNNWEMERRNREPIMIHDTWTLSPFFLQFWSYLFFSMWLSNPYNWKRSI